MIFCATFFSPKSYISKQDEIELFGYYDKVQVFTLYFTKSLLKSFSLGKHANTIDYSIQNPPMKQVHSFRRKNLYPIKRISNFSLNPNDIVRMTIIFNNLNELILFDSFLHKKYQNNIISYSNMICKQNSRYKSINIKFMIDSLYFNFVFPRNFYIDKNKKCIYYPIIELQIQMKNHFYYQRITHNFYKAVRNLEIISYYFGNEYFSSKEIYFLEDQNTPHYQMFLTKYSYHTGKIKDIEVNLFYYEAFFFVLQSKRLFNIDKELSNYIILYISIILDFLKLKNVIGIKLKINNLLKFIYKMANNKDLQK